MASALLPDHAADRSAARYARVRLAVWFARTGRRHAGAPRLVRPGAWLVGL